MSRIGKNPIEIPAGVSFTLKSNTASFKGPKGNLQVQIHPEIAVKEEGNELIVSRPTESRRHRALHGTVRQLLANSVEGVHTGFTKELEIRGIGYQATVENNRMTLALGYSHDIILDPPEGIVLDAKRTEITVFGIDKQLVGEVAAKIRSFRKPEPYKGKGIRYKDEIVRTKQGKTVGGK